MGFVIQGWRVYGLERARAGESAGQDTKEALEVMVWRAPWRDESHANPISSIYLLQRDDQWRLLDIGYMEVDSSSFSDVSSQIYLHRRVPASPFTRTQYVVNSA